MTIEITSMDPLYRLGRIASVIEYACYPGHARIPEAMLDVILARPLAGLAQVTRWLDHNARSPEVAADAHDAIGHLLQDVEIPAQTGSIDEQGPYWTGYYHQRAGMRRQRLSPEMLRAAGEALYGQQWQTDLARGLGVDSRRVRQWLTAAAPKWVVAEVYALLRTKSRETAAVADSLLAAARADKPAADESPQPA